MRARALILAAALAAVLLSALPAALAAPEGSSQGAFGNPNDPNGPASPVARDINDLFNWMTIAAIITGVFVQSFIALAIWKFRAKPGDGEAAHDEEPAEVPKELQKSEGAPAKTVPHDHHGDWRVEAGYTAVTAVIFILIAILSKGVLDQIETPNAPVDLQVNVTGHQWFWEFHYPGANITESGGVAEMHVPINKVVGLSITSVDVLHAVWIPNLGVKIDAVPGHQNHFWFKAEKEGRFLLQCAEYCSGAHSMMHGVVVVQSQADFDAWVVAQQIAQRPPPVIPQVSGGQFNVTLTAAGPDPAAINFVQGANVSLFVHNGLSVPSALAFEAPYNGTAMADVPANGDGWLNLSFTAAVVRGNYTCTAGCAAGGVFNVSQGARIVDVELRQTAGSFGIWSIFPEEITAHPGEVIQFSVKNTGTADHNFSVLGSYQFYVHGTAGPTIPPGATVLSDKFTVGTENAPYICSVPGHDGLGMKGELTVVGGTAPPPGGSAHNAPEGNVPGFEGLAATLALVGVAVVAAARRRA